MNGDLEVLARIDATRFWGRPPAEREEIRLWLVANGVDTGAVLARPGWDAVQVVLLDAPMIVRQEAVLGENGRARIGEDGELLTRTVHSLCRVPLPEHLADSS